MNTARGAICNAEDVAAALKSGQLRGYSGDVWNVQPAPRDHPWRTMKNPLGGGNGMVPHYSGTTLDAQQRYANGTKEILENYFNNKAQNPANVIIGNSESFDSTHQCSAHVVCRGLRDQVLRPTVRDGLCDFVVFAAPCSVCAISWKYCTFACTLLYFCPKDNLSALQALEYVPAIRNSGSAKEFQAKPARRE